MDRRQLEIRRLIKGLGLRFESSDQSGRHHKITLSKGDVIKKVIFPVTHSDRRWRLNMESHLKKIFEL